MGAAIPGAGCAARNSSASGAQVIDGSLRFDIQKKNALSFQPSSNGDKKKSTIAGWFKRAANSWGNIQSLFTVYQGTNSDYFEINLIAHQFRVYNRSDSQNSGTAVDIWTNNYYRDFSGWYHFVVVLDSPQPTTSDRLKIYINGIRQLSLQATQYPSLNYDFFTASTNIEKRGISQIFWTGGTTAWQQFDGSMSQVYFIDGQALGPENFGYTDPLTNTWRPKKYEGAFGTNGFWLPMDGNSPIGKDQSGNGNDWTPVNFGGSNIIPKATGALPILNTVNGGKVATAGVFGSKENQFITVTVQPGSGTAASAFTFDGVERGSLATIRGATITFDTTNATNNTHPFKLSSTNADSSGGTEYTDGVAYYINGSVTTGANYVTNYATGAASGFRGIKWTVPYNSPSPLYYYCTMHTGMGESGRLTSTTDEKKADPYANNVVLALPLVGLANDVSNQINSGSTTKTVTVTNAVTSPISNFYGGSYYFDATGDYISTGLSSSDFTFGTGSFTVEGWFKYDDKDTYDPGLFQISDAAAGSGTYPGCVYLAAAGASNRLYVDVGNDWYGYTAAGSYYEEDGLWHHIAIVGDSGTDVRLYIDGILHPLELGVYNNYNVDVATYVTIGKYYSNSDYEFGGAIQDFRVYKGVAKYTKNFIPASTNPDILPDTPSGIAYDSQLAKAPVTDGAVSFDGTGDYLEVPKSTDFDFPGEFTMEAWVYVNSYSVENTAIFESIDWNSQVGQYSFGISSDSNNNRVQFYYFDGSNVYEKGTNRLGTNRWYHVAVSRDSSSDIRLFVDGVLETTVNNSYSFSNSNQPNPARIGGTKMGNSGSGIQDALDGFISNVRIIKGTALYTSDFKPPSAPLTDVTNTKLLCCQSNTSATAAAVSPTTIAVGGDAMATNFNPFTDDINTVMGPPTGYCTWEAACISGAGNSLEQGNLKATHTASTGWTGGVGTINQSATFVGTFGMTSGKWYFEVTPNSGDLPSVGITPVVDGPYYVGYAGNGVGHTNTYVYNSDWQVPVTPTNPIAMALNDVLGVAVDMDNGFVWFSINGTWQNSGDPTDTDIASNGAYGDGFVGETMFPAVSQVGSNYSMDITANFGQKPFLYAPPEGFQPLNFENLSSPGVVRSDKVVTATKWTSTGGSSTYDVDCGLAPDLIWHKCYDGSQNNSVFTSILGPDSRLDTSGNSGEQDWHPAYFTGFTHNGYSVSSTSSDLNPAAGAKMISYCWKAGGSKGTFNKDGIVYASAADAGLDGGSATPSASSVGTKNGFSIIKVAGSNTASKTFSHGLSQAPTFAIGKLLAVAPSNGLDQDWQVYHKVGMGNTKGLQLNLSTTEETSSALWNNNYPDDTLFSIGASTRWEGNFIMYLWHDVPGLQKFGMYNATGSDAYGPFVYLGFKPAIIMLMCYSGSGENRYIYSDKASEWQAQSANPNYSPSFLNDNAAANTSTTGYRVDFLSNGFRMRQANGPNTGSPVSKYLYAAWAHQPMNNLYGAQSNAY